MHENEVSPGSCGLDFARIITRLDVLRRRPAPLCDRGQLGVNNTAAERAGLMETLMRDAGSMTGLNGYCKCSGD